MENDTREQRKARVIPDVVLYRYDGYERVNISEYLAVKETKCCYWVVPRWDIMDTPKQCYKNAGKSTAHVTKEAAMYSFRRRKLMQKQHLLRMLSRVEEALDHTDSTTSDKLPSNLFNGL